MATKFFIGGNEFYNDEEEADHALESFRIRYGIPVEEFSIVKIHKDDKEAPASATVH